MRGGTAAMGATRYKRHRITNGDLLVYTHLMAEDNQEELLRLRHALGSADAQRRQIGSRRWRFLARRKLGKLLGKRRVGSAATTHDVHTYIQHLLHDLGKFVRCDIVDSLAVF